LRAPGANRTTLTRSRDGGSADVSRSIQASPVNVSAGALVVGCFGCISTRILTDRSRVGSRCARPPPLIRVRLELRGRGANTNLVAALNDLDGVVEVRTEDVEDY
jgi:hypothetical protein